MRNTTDQSKQEPQPAATGPRSLFAHTIWMASSVKLGLVLMVAIAAYAALASVPLGPAFRWLGGEEWLPGRTLRHLPWVDLRETEYFATPLFSALLLAMVINMTLASVLRIPWRWRKTGVLLTHSGVVVLALGAFFATRSPLNATLAAFSDLPTESAIDRSRTLIVKSADRASSRVERLLPRYADFGVPWTERERALRVGPDQYITGFAHSARLADQIVEGDAGDPRGWQLEEQLATGETRSFVLRAVHGSEARTELSDGTVVLALDDVFDRSDNPAPLTDFQSRRGRGGVLIRATPEGPTLWLPAFAGATTESESAAGVWRAEFLDQSAFMFGSEVASFRLQGPESDSLLYFAGQWDPTMSGVFAQSPDGGSIDLMEPPVGLRALYMSAGQDAIVLGHNVATAFASGAVRSFAFDEGGTVHLNESTRITVERFLPHSKVASQIQRVPMIEDAQLLADPRLGSLVRYSASPSPRAADEWIEFDDVETTGLQYSAIAYRPARLSIDDARVIFRGFRAELFRRGSIPKDFQIELELQRSGESTQHTLSLNQPLRAKLKIDGRMRSVQFSLIGWDSEGWEAARGGQDDRFQGTRFVILAINQREGVSLAISGGAMVLLGAGLSMAMRLHRPRNKRERAG